MQEYRTQVMKKLFIYIFTFCIMITVVSFAITLFSQNLKRLKTNTDSLSDLTRLNLYFLNIVKDKNTIIKKYGLTSLEDDNSYFITFENGAGQINTFVKEGNFIYLNNILLCENVEKFIIDINNYTNEIISVKLQIAGDNYDLQYVI